MKKIWKHLVIAVACLVPTMGAAAAEVEGGPLVEPVDQRELHTTWRNMANEQVMFPLDMRDLPVRIGPERQLFLDNYLIAEAKDITRQVHQPLRYKGNPVVTPTPHDPEIQDEENRVCEGCVMQFDASPRFRMWYWSYPGWHKWKNAQQIRFAGSYAVSDDGMNWEKPNLDLYRLEGSNLRDIVIPYGQMHGVFYRPDEADPEKRFQALVCVEIRGAGGSTEGYYLHSSADGIHWKGDLSRPVIPVISGYVFPIISPGDTSRFWWDPLGKRYLGDVKFILPGKIRCRGIMESDDLVHWSRARPTFFGRSGNDQIYGHRGFVYQGMYVGMRWIYVPERATHHAQYVELDCSRDGLVWTRVGAGQPFMAFNPNHDTWDASKMMPIGMLEVGDDIWIYYTGMPTDLELKNPKFPNSQRVGVSVGLAKLKRDRFVSLNGGERTGILTTRPLRFKGKKLYVNVDVKEGGSLKVALLGRDGEPIESYSLDEAVPIESGGLTVPVKWKTEGKSELCTDEHVRLQFQLQNAKLYAFWVD